MLQQAKQLKQRLAELEKSLQESAVVSNPKKLQALSQEYSSLKDKAAVAESYEKVSQALDDANKTKAEADDPELAQMAADEIVKLETEKQDLEAKLIALACSKPPKGRTRWTLRLLEKKVVELKIVGILLKLL